MKILIAENDPMARRLLAGILTAWGHDVVVTQDGREAWGVLQSANAPQLAILDCVMPEIDVLEVCRRARQTKATESVYLILLTARGDRANIVAGLEAGANDYLAKPLNFDELRARLQVGERVVEMQHAMAADLAERKRAEEALRQSEEQLRQVQKLEAVGQLAGGIAHDFNNLLTVINGYTEIALMTLPANDPMRRSVKEIKKAGDRAAALTRQLLAFSRKQILQPKILDLNSLVTDMGKLLRRLIPESVEFITLLRPEIGQINADPGQVEQVLMNLVVNARDAMPQGGKIIIETANVEIDEEFAARYASISAGAYVMLSVSDTGCGIDVETQKHIFEPFFTTKEVDKGTGLGLATVYGIVKQSGGSIWVDSEVGVGSTFKVYLPWHRAEREISDGISLPIVEPSGSETILLVEDEETVRGLARHILESSGYKVLEAGLGTEALSICEQYDEPIHALLTDVVMPRMSGPELALALAERQTEIPVLYMSGYTDDAIVNHGVLDPGTHFLEKPFTPDSLLRMIRHVLDAPPASLALASFAGDNLAAVS